jgi:hypothetical protein
VPLQEHLDFIEKIREVALCFSHGEWAGRQGDAAQRIQAKPTEACVVAETMLRDQGLDARAGLRSDIGDDDVLVRGQAEPSFVSFRNGPHAVQQTHLVDVRDPAGREIDAESRNPSSVLVQPK